MVNENLGRDEIGRKGGMASGSSTMSREGSAGGQVKQGWNDFRTKVRSKWNQITDKDLDGYQNRGRDDLVNFIGDRVGGDRTSIGRDVDSYARETNYRW